MKTLQDMMNRNDASVWAHPELAASYAADTGLVNDLSALFEDGVDYPERKARYDTAMGPMIELIHSMGLDVINVPEGFVEKHYEIPAREGRPALPVTVIAPVAEKPRKKPCIINIAGGGLYFWSAFPAYTSALAKRCDAVVVSLDDARTIFHDDDAASCYPKLIDDVFACYEWTFDNAEELGINTDKMVVTGISSGGHMTTVMAHRLKAAGYRPRGCVAICPIVDESNDFASGKRHVDAWGSTNVDLTSNAYLGELAGTDQIPADAFVAHATAEECIGLAPQFLHTFENDPQMDAVLAYAGKLIQAGVYTETHQWGGAEHGSFTGCIGLPDDQVSPYQRRMIDMIFANINDCFKYDLRRA